MKFFVVFACIVASISALPSLQKFQEIDYTNERIVTGQIVDAINGVSQDIKDAGLDPLVIKREAASYALAVPEIFNAAGFVEDLLSTGLSNIQVRRMNFSVLLMRLTFDIELPHIHFSVGQAIGEAVLFDNVLSASVAGSVDIRRIRITGQVNVRAGIISGVSVTNISLDFTLNSIDSALRINVNQFDLSDTVNTFLGQTIPDTLRAFRNDINRLLNIVLLDVINEALNDL